MIAGPAFGGTRRKRDLTSLVAVERGGAAAEAADYLTVRAIWTWIRDAARTRGALRRGPATLAGSRTCGSSRPSTTRARKVARCCPSAGAIRS
jgi:hypothetical protein